MLEYYLQHFGPASQAILEYWHVAAIQHGSLAFLERLLGDASLAAGRAILRVCLFG